MTRDYDLVGIGFGPSNLSLATTIHETRPSIHVKFLEREPEFGWHRGMLIPGTTMQVSFLKDLATMRDPGSHFSFLNYLHCHDRLTDFINAKSFFPTRLEFHDYLRWAAQQVADQVEYNTTVDTVAPVRSDGQVVAFDVATTSSGSPRLFRARNLVMSTGLKPKLPRGVAPSPRVCHSSQLLHCLEHLDWKPRSIGVVGAGQSAAEIVQHTYDRFPDAKIYSIFSSYGFIQSDDTPLANRVFDPDAVDRFHSAPQRVRDMIFDKHRNTNYAVVDAELINSIYERLYADKVAGIRRLNMVNLTQLVAAEEHDGIVTATVNDLCADTQRDIELDLLVCATGYEPADPAALLRDCELFLHRDAHGRLDVGRNYRIRCDAHVDAGIYMQGGNEHTHGISASLLSNTAVRAQEILESIRCSITRDRPHQELAPV